VQCSESYKKNLNRNIFDWRRIFSCRSESVIRRRRVVEECCWAMTGDWAVVLQTIREYSFGIKPYVASLIQGVKPSLSAL